jgi:hypothetical protein
MWDRLRFPNILILICVNKLIVMILIMGLFSLSFHYKSEMRDKGSHDVWEIISLQFRRRKTAWLFPFYPCHQSHGMNCLRFLPGYLDNNHIIWESVVLCFKIYTIYYFCPYYQLILIQLNSLSRVMPDMLSVQSNIDKNWDKNWGVRFAIYICIHTHTHTHTHMYHMCLFCMQRGRVHGDKMWC